LLAPLRSLMRSAGDVCIPPGSLRSARTSLLAPLRSLIGSAGTPAPRLAHFVPLALRCSPPPLPFLDRRRTPVSRLAHSVPLALRCSLHSVRLLDRSDHGRGKCSEATEDYRRSPIRSHSCSSSITRRRVGHCARAADQCWSHAKKVGLTAAER